MGVALVSFFMVVWGAFCRVLDFFLYGVFCHVMGPLLFVLLFVVIVLVRITTPRLRIEAMGRLGWQPMLWLLLLTFACYFVGWFLA